ncbi:unnamed protein product [Allacma fusca]|uniref:DNA mismatch repair proteins mutS family domain-containing protein n=1 Tax=Allacma fusca TaxID=39272 RepID=A0A8J2LH97_9HEXA|nr:unnamed protein product [Allacma fusca]
MDRKPVLCLLWAGGKLGAAYFDIENSELFLLSDTSENPMDFEIVKLIYRQVEPGIILLSTRQDQRLVSLVTELIKVEDVVGTEDDTPSFSRSRISPGISISRGSSPAFVTSPSLSGLNEFPKPIKDETFFTPRDTQCSMSSGSWGVQYGEVDPPGRARDGGRCGCQLITVAAKEFAPDPCKARVKAQRLPREGDSVDSSNHLIFVTSLISFKNMCMVRAAGALLSFMDKNGLSLFNLRMKDGRVHVEDIRTFQLDDLVLVDDTAWSSLQVFNIEDHPAPAKQGVFRSTKEGLSVYSLLDRCLTIQGSKLLKTMLLRPTRNLQTLNRRFDVIDFCSNPLNMEFVRNACECLRAIKSWPNLITKVEALHASVNDWKDLYQTIYHFVLMADVTSRQSDSIQLFREICVFDQVKRLRAVAERMTRTIDFEESKSCSRFIPRAGINLILDRTRKQYSCLPKIMTKVAEQEIHLLPAYIVQCSVVYVPEIGYLLAVNYWKELLTPDELQLPGLEYKFSNYCIAYYKSKRTMELDEVLGDFQVSMVEQETNAMLTLTEAILGEKTVFMEMGRLISELDCLIAMSKAASEFNFIRPTIVDSDECLEIKDGKHPLVGMSNFVPNSTLFSGQERIVILTGPNASGKSIYLKQVGVITLMALSGSFVPASFARVPAFDRICTKIHPVESVSLGLSTFLIDLNQMAFGLRESTKSSLIIIDEFGKGTAESDGLALLIASVNDLIRRSSECPTVFISTHFYSLMNYMDQSRLLKFQTMQFVRENNDIVYLYKLIDGMSKKSFASVTALQTGVNEAVVERFEKLHDIIIRNESDLEELKFPATPKQSALIELAKKFMEMDLDAIEPVEYVTEIQQIMKPFRDEEANAAIVHNECLHNRTVPTPKSIRSTDEEEFHNYSRPVASNNISSSTCTVANFRTSSIPDFFSNNTTQSSSEEYGSTLPSKRRLVTYSTVESFQSQHTNNFLNSENFTETSGNFDFEMSSQSLENIYATTPTSSGCSDRCTISKYFQGRTLASSSLSSASTSEPVPRGATLISPNLDDFGKADVFSSPTSIGSVSTLLSSQSAPERAERLGYTPVGEAHDDIFALNCSANERSFHSSSVQYEEEHVSDDIFVSFNQYSEHDSLFFG